MTRTNMAEDVTRYRVMRDIPSDALQVDEDDEGTTTVELYYHEPESRTKPVRTPMGTMLAIQKPRTEVAVASLLDDIEMVTEPDDIEVEDKNGFFVITLTYSDGNNW